MKIILNYLPPGNIDYPSPSLSILQSFLNHNGFTTKTIYWNILMFHIMSHYAINKDLIRNLFPFLTVIAEEYNDRILKNRLRAFLQTLQPYFKTKDNFYCNSLDEIRNTVLRIINSELNNDKNEAGLYGISAKFYQWIPGIVLSKEIKKRYPNCKIVIGGLSSRDSAIAIMKKFHDFDYAIWGEGEYPLLDLCNYIKNNSVNPEDISRLVFRENGDIKTSKNNKSNYLDFNNYIFPDIDDYFECLSANNISKEIVKIMINSVSGCRWNRCSFCSYSQGKVFRERNAENIFQEIRLCSEKYDINNFYFSDNDIVGKDPGRFEKLLDLLIDYKKNIKSDLRIYGEMIPASKITLDIFHKMALAGFTAIYIGYEAVTEQLLHKMNKSNTFSENIFFIKSALKCKIKPQVNIIQGIPSETEDDIIESINNLHFLRFYFNDKDIEFIHIYSPLNLYKGTKYFLKIPDDEKVSFDQNSVMDYIPQSFIEHEERFNFFSFRRNILKNNNLWSDFEIIEKFYRKNKFTYLLIKNESSFVYKEFFNDKEIKNIEFNNMIYYEILEQADYQIVSFDSMFLKLYTKYPDLTTDKLKEYLGELKDYYILYYDDTYSAIVSIIN
ncbi:MAG: radical SAM protein [Bacteroidia bacterium]|nr:radical SAM protein [Bacteroidia bacterium]